MKWLGSFILACLALATAFLGIFNGSVAAGFHVLGKWLEVAPTIDQASMMPLSSAPPAAAIDVGARTRSVQFYIVNELGEGQLAETLTVHLGNPPTHVGELTLSPIQRQAVLSLRGESGPGRYQYSLESTMVVLTEAGLQPISCSGEGTVRVRDQSRFEAHLVSYHPQSGQCRIGLQ